MKDPQVVASLARADQSLATLRATVATLAESVRASLAEGSDPTVVAAVWTACLARGAGRHELAELAAVTLLVLAETRVDTTRRGRHGDG